MDIQFQGLNPVFSAPLLVLLIAAVLFFAWWSYSYLTSLSPTRRWSLTLLRGSALVILLLLLLNPFLQIDEIEQHKPILAVYLDDSQSMGIERGEYRGWDSYKSIIDAFGFDEIDELDIQYYRFDGQIESTEYSDLQLQGTLTNIDEVMRHIRDRSEETVAAMLFSDGIITRGRDPIFTARELHMPVFTVPVGDTSETRDVAISEVLTNETGYVDTEQPVEITVTQEGFPDEAATLQLRRDGEIIESGEIQFDRSSSTHRTTFTLQFEEAGLHHYEAYIPELEGEITAENNLYPFSVNVVDEKTNIYHLAFEIHPDVKSVRTILEADRNIELHPFTWIGDRFLEGDLDEIPDDLELLVIHGAIPDQAGLPDGLIDQFPAVQFYLPGVNADDLSAFVIPVSVANPGSVLGIHLAPGEENRNHPILELDPIEFNRQPVLSSLQASYELPATASVLIRASYEGAETGIPVLITEEAGNLRRAVVNTHGWFRYTQARDEQTRNYATGLIANITSWAATSPDSENLRIQPGKLVYQEGEEINFRAELSNETGEPETDAVIEVTVSDANNDERSYTMRHRSNGNYHLTTGAIAAGNYTYSAEARKGGRVIDTAEGDFTVTASTLEYVDTRRDDEMLRRLAEVSGGEFLQEFSPAAILGELDNRNLLQQIEERRTAFRFLHEHVIWFILVMLLLTGEWLLRRKYSLP